MLAAHLRLAATLQTVVDTPLRADAGEYMSYALNLRMHGVYSRAPPGPAAPAPDAVRPPGYPLLLAALVGDPLGPRTLLNIALVQAFLGVGIVLGVFLLGQRFLPPGAALVAALLAAVSPQLVNAGVFVLSEVLFAVLLVGLLLAWTAPGGRRRAWLVAAGAILGAAMLTRPTANYLVIFLAGLLFLQRPRREAVAACACLLAATLLVYAPWPARNLARFGVAEDPTLRAASVYHGLYPDFTYEGAPSSYGYPYRFDPRAAEIQADLPSVLAEIRRRFAAEPLRHLRWYLLGKPAALWGWHDPQSPLATFAYPVVRSPYFERPLFDWSYEAMRLLNWPLALLAGLYSIVVWTPAFAARTRPASLLAARSVALLLLYATAVHIAAAPFARYAVPFRPELFLAAVGGARFLWEHGARRLTGGSSHEQA